MRVAIIGAGVSGLVCAHRLHAAHEIVVYEAADRAGGHANTVEVGTERGRFAVDTGFIVFNDRNYPALEALLRELGVATQPSDMSFSVSDGADFEYSGASVGGLFARRSHLLSPRFWRMIADLVRFNRAARELLADTDGDPSLREWLAARGYSELFVEGLIVPQAAAVWSADPDQLWTFPARFVAEFFDNHGMLGFVGRPRWRTVCGGSRVYVNALMEGFGDAVRLCSPVRSVRRVDDSVLVEAGSGSGSGSGSGLGSGSGDVERFDAVVFAVHSDQALELLADASDTEREVLGALPYARNEAVLHTDASLLPRRRRAWASWNYHVGQAGASGPGRPTVTG